MWQRRGRRNAKRSGAAAPLSGALGRVGGLFGRQETKKHVRTTTYGGPVGLGLLGALALVATVSIVLVLRRRAARQGSPVEESNDEAIEANEEA
jgi:nitrate/nitrite transporter NarK